jgi:hypothetical protein
VWNLESEPPLHRGDAPEAATHGHGGAIDLDVSPLVVHLVLTFRCLVGSRTSDHWFWDELVVAWLEHARLCGLLLGGGSVMAITKCRILLWG